MSRDEEVDERLREILARLPLEGVATPECPSPETIWDAASGSLPPDRVGTLGEHAAGCLACTAVWREATILAREVASGRDSAPPSRGPYPGRIALHWRLFAALGAAALLGMVAICLSQYDPPPKGGDSVLREPEAGSIRSLLSEAAPIARDDFRLRWTDWSVGARYRVQVTTAELDLLSEGRDLERPEFLVPVTALQDVAVGEAVLWQVEAVVPDGSRVTSPTFVAQVR